MNNLVPTVENNIYISAQRTHYNFKLELARKKWCIIPNKLYKSRKKFPWEYKTAFILLDNNYKYKNST